MTEDELREIEARWARQYEWLELSHYSLSPIDQDHAAMLAEVRRLQGVLTALVEAAQDADAMMDYAAMDGYRPAPGPYALQWSGAHIGLRQAIKAVGGEVTGTEGERLTK